MASLPTKPDNGGTPASEKIGIIASAATTGFRIESSRDNTNWRVLAQAGTAASTVATLGADLLYRYARVVFVNGASAQTSFELGLNALPAT